MCTNGCVDAVPKNRSQRTASGSGTLLLTLMPKFGCPLCWPVLTALLGFFGLHIEALNGLFIGVAVVSLAIVCISCLRNPQNRIQSMLLGICLVILLGYRLALLPAGATYLSGAIVAVNFVWRRGLVLLQRFKSERHLERALLPPAEVDLADFEIASQNFR